MPPKKKLNKKALLKKREEERLLQEELARQERERIRLLEEEERLKKAEEARIKAEEDQKRSEQETEIGEYILRVSRLSNYKCAKEWEEKRWNDYMYKTKEMDCLKLPLVNAFITEWKDDSSYEIESISQISHRCLQIVDEIQSAVFKCPEVYAKTRLWKEGIVNLKKAIGQKLDYASFMLLKDAYHYLNEKTQNMEYGFSDNHFTLCLWANIHRTLRRHGMEKNGFRFWIPPDLVEEDCAVRILKLSFPPTLELLFYPTADDDQEDSISDEKFKSNELIRKSTDIILENILTEETLKEDNDVSAEDEEHKTADNNTKNETSENLKLTTSEQKSDFNVTPEATDIPSEKELENNIQEIVKDDKNFPDARSTISSEQKGKFLDFNEYFLVGGLVHFDLLEVPKLTIQKNGFTYIHREEPKLKRIECEPKPLHPVFALAQDQSKVKFVETEKTEQREKQEEETSDSDSEASQTSLETIKQYIGLRMPLPANLVLMDVLQPALFYPEEKAFSAKGIALEDYSEEEKVMSFETDQFGILGLFQKLYSNFPYQTWQVQGGKISELILVGKFVTLRIAISEEGCRLESIKPDQRVQSSGTKNLVSKIWMTPAQLIEKLLSIGLNIAYGKKASKFIGNSQKKSKLEEGVYNSIALLSEDYDFSWSKWNNKLPSGGIALNCRHVSERVEEKYKVVLIRKERAVELKQGEDIETFSNEPVSNEFSGTLYHLVQGNTPTSMEEIASRSGLVENVRVLLQRCRILSAG